MIQGQYGPQFNSAQRRRLLRFMAHNGFNAYVHAPKGDPYQRTLWRDPYPSDQQASLDSEVQLATRLGIEWIPNVSPAAAAVSSPGDAAPPGTSPSPPICFSSDADLAQLLAKFEPFRQAGSDTFMVSFDDVRREFSCAADDAEYGGGDRAFGLANADLLNRLYAKLRERDPDAQLLTVASDYEGTADTAYLHAIRGALAPGIDVMWTGPSTESRPFSPDDADAYAGAIGRAPIVWENWTANDVLSPPTAGPRACSSAPTRGVPTLSATCRVSSSIPQTSRTSTSSRSRPPPTGCGTPPTTGRAAPSSPRPASWPGASRRPCVHSPRPTTPRPCGAASRRPP